MSFINQDDFADVITTPPRLNATDPLNQDTTATLNTIGLLNPDAEQTIIQETMQPNYDFLRCFADCCIGAPSDANNSDCCQALCCCDFWSDCGTFLTADCCCCGDACCAVCEYCSGCEVFAEICATCVCCS